MYCFYDNKIIKYEDISISPRDLGFNRAFGVFTYLRTYKKQINDSVYIDKVLYLEKYIEGFLSSADIVNIQHKYTKEFLIKKVVEVLELNTQIFGPDDKCIKIILTGGVSSGMRQENITNPTLLILIDKFLPFDHVLYQTGVTLQISEYQRDFPESKTLNYIAGVRIIANKSIFEPLYINPKTKFILETSNSNFFFVKDNILYTQKNNIFRGVVRDLILTDFGDFLKINNVVQDILEKEDIDINFLTGAQAIFITGAAKEILPVNIIIDHNNNEVYNDIYMIKDNILLQDIILNWREFVNKRI